MKPKLPKRKQQLKLKPLLKKRLIKQLVTKKLTKKREDKHSTPQSMIQKLQAQQHQEPTICVRNTVTSMT